VLVANDRSTMAVDEELRHILSKVQLQEPHLQAAAKPAEDRQRLDYYTHRIEFPTRFSDTDAIGHLNNVAHLRYCDEGRAQLFVEAIGDADPAALGTVVSFDISYLREGQCFTPIVIATSVENAHAGRVRLAQALFQDGQCIATCDWEIRVSERITDGLQRFVRVIK
jgi:acyl-CoA thioester hydrolase